MDIVSINLYLKALNQSADFVKKLQEIHMNFSMASEVKKTNAKLDQDITRKIKSGYGSIGFALMPNRELEHKKQDVEDARRFLHDCLNLSDELETAGEPNSDVMGTAHFGLAIVYNLKGDSQKASHHLFNAFKYSPRKARELSPEIYNQFFKPHCGTLVMILNKEQAMLTVESRVLMANFGSTEEELINAATEAGKLALKALSVAGGFAAMFLTGGRVNPHVFLSSSSAANKEIDKIQPDRAIEARVNAKVQKEAEELILRLEADAQKQDICCKQKATEYLSKLNPGALPYVTLDDVR